MQIENHKEEVPFAHYCERFAALDRAVQKRRVAAVYAVKKSKSENAFSLCHE